MRVAFSFIFWLVSSFKSMRIIIFNMDGRAHRFFGFNCTTLTMAIMTFWYKSKILSYAPKNTTEIFVATLILLFIASFFYTGATKYRNKNERKKYQWREYIAWSFMIFTISLTIFTAHFLPEGRSTSSAVATISSLTITYSGSMFPDWDLDWGIDAHRSPFTHSWIIPFTIWIWSMIVIPYEERYINFLTGIFCIAYASHLIADCVSAKTEGMTRIIIEFFNMKKVPGDIRKIDEKFEHPLLFISSIVLIIAFVFSLKRIYGAVGYDWDISEWPDERMEKLIIIGGASLLIFTLMFLYSHINEPKSKSTSS